MLYQLIFLHNGYFFYAHKVGIITDGLDISRLASTRLVLRLWTKLLCCIIALIYWSAISMPSNAFAHLTDWILAILSNSVNIISKLFSCLRSSTRSSTHRYFRRCWQISQAAACVPETNNQNSSWYNLTLPKPQNSMFNTTAYTISVQVRNIWTFINCHFIITWLSANLDICIWWHFIFLPVCSIQYIISNIIIIYNNIMIIFI